MRWHQPAGPDDIPRIGRPAGWAPVVIPPPFDSQRSRDLVRRLDAVPALVKQARQNLDRMRGPFLRVALEQLRDVRPRLSRTAEALRPVLAGDAANAIVPSAERAATALESFRTWLEQRAKGLPEKTAVGREAYLFFLREVALVPFTSEQLVAAGRQELDRALTFEALALDRSGSGRGSGSGSAMFTTSCSPTATSPCRS